MSFLTNFQEQVMETLKDGEWHSLPPRPNMAMRVRTLIQLGYINYHAIGDQKMAIATEAGMEYLRRMSDKWAPQS